jgi:membrane associated rhomboid family serine protease
MWFVFAISLILPFDLAILGIYPRSLSGSIGIVFAPLIHGDIVHLVSNSVPLLFLGIVLFFFYNQIAKRVLMQCYFLTNVLVWIFARTSLHIGASGLVYGIASFLVFFGIFRKDFRSILISLVILLMYGGLIYGVLPQQEGISWESHLLGAIVGILSASQMSKTRKVSIK